MRPLHTLALALLLAATLPASVSAQQTSTWWRTLPDGCRLFTECPLETHRPRILVLYATPNGNSIEQTLGARPENESAWRFDIQHVAAQVRRVRQLRSEASIALSVIEAPGRSWPAYLTRLPQAPATTMRIVQYLRNQTDADEVILCGHSGGGSFLLRCIAAGPIPQYIRRFVFLDANYSWDNSQHATPILQWLQNNPRNHLINVAYDDRSVELNGRRVVSDDGGTWRATERMVEGLGGRSAFTETALGPCQHLTAFNGQVQFLLHTNPQRRILHTALVGDMNGLICSLAENPDANGNWQRLLQPRDYQPLIPESPPQAPGTARIATTVTPAPMPPLPARQPQASPGSQLLTSLRDCSLADREQRLLAELQAGNVPRHSRSFVPLQIEASTADGQRLSAVGFVTADFLAVGSDDDFCRIAVTPGTASRMARILGCLLITPKLSDDIHDAATVRLQPQPLTEQRESAATLLQHENLIRQQLLMQETAEPFLLSGVKKDLVLTTRLLGKPRKVALYGWQQPDGLPIQPVYAGHSQQYVDYSHAVRLIHETLWINHQPHSTTEILSDPVLWPLLTREGPLNPEQIAAESQW